MTAQQCAAIIRRRSALAVAVAVAVAVTGGVGVAYLVNRSRRAGCF